MSEIAYNVGQSTVYVDDNGTVTVQQGYITSPGNIYGTKAWRDNNPGNILQASGSYPGGIGADTGQYNNDKIPEIIFPTMAAGQAAMVALLQGNQYLGANLTIYQAIFKYSPPE